MKRLLTVFVICFITYNLYSQSQNESITPIVGNEKFFVDNHLDELRFNQLIPVESIKDVLEIKKYISKFLRDKNIKVIDDKITLLDMLTTFIELDVKTAYIYISPVSDRLIWKQPYKKNNKICFDVKRENPDDTPYVSIWVFYVNKNEEFSLKFISDGTGLEQGKYSLLPEHFRKGNKLVEECGDFNIIAFGEYFIEKYIEFKDDVVENEFNVYDFKNYCDLFKAEIGTKIGFRYEHLIGDEIEYTIKIIHPEYTAGPDKGKTEDIFPWKFGPNEIDDFIWEFSEEYEIVPGEWIFQIFNSEKLLFEKSCIIN